MKFDLTTFGETMIRISVRPGNSLLNTNDVDLHTGGTESNTAVCLARLGMKTGWVSRLTGNALGKRVETDIARHGVDTGCIVWTKEDRVGTYYVEFATPPRSSTVTYDRRHSAISKVKPEELPWDYLLNTRVLHLTGITPALSTSCHQAVALAIKKAKAKKIAISFDVNYRAKLWSPAECAKALTPLMKGVNLLVMTSEDAATVFKLKSAAEVVVKEIYGMFQPEVAVLTMGGKGAIAWDGHVKLFEPGFTLTEVVDRLGAGDAFTAGLLYGYLHNDLKLGLRYGIVTSAMKIGMRGDYWWGGKEEVELVIQSHGRDVQR